jgi:hypothetical protein
VTVIAAPGERPGFELLLGDRFGEPPDVVLAKDQFLREQAERRKEAEWEEAQVWTNILPDRRELTLSLLLRVQREIEDGFRILGCNPILWPVPPDAYKTPTGRYVVRLMDTRNQARGFNDLVEWLDAKLKVRFSADAIEQAIQHLAQEQKESLQEAGETTIVKAVEKLIGVNETMARFFYEERCKPKAEKLTDENILKKAQREHPEWGIDFGIQYMRKLADKYQEDHPNLPRISKRPYKRT